MVCPNCKIGTIRLEEPKKEEGAKSYAVCISCLSVFDVVLNYVEGTWFDMLNRDHQTIKYAHHKANPMKDKPDYFSFND